MDAPDPEAARAPDAPDHRGFRVRALGEIAIRTANLAAMTAFYRDVIGLEILPGAYPANIVFFRIGPGFGGHTSVLALFADSAPKPPSSLHHLALSLSAAEQDAVLAWYRRLVQACTVERFDWIGWRGIFTRDPDGNSVELVAYTAEESAPDSGPDPQD